MRKAKLYLETSVWNFYYADDSPEKKWETLQFFRNINKRYDIFISGIVMDEINNSDTETRNKLIALVGKFNPVRLIVTSEVEELAEKYIMASAVPKRKIEDALHASITTVNMLDMLVSWNCRHLARASRKAKINGVNMQNGYKLIDIITPMEVG